MIPFVPLRPFLIGAAVTVPIPFAVSIDIEFSESMNTALTPGNVNVELVANGVPTWGTFASWTDSTHARYNFGIVWPPANATIQLKVLDLQIQNITGAICKVSVPFVIVP